MTAVKTPWLRPRQKIRSAIYSVTRVGAWYVVDNGGIGAGRPWAVIPVHKGGGTMMVLPRSLSRQSVKDTVNAANRERTARRPSSSNAKKTPQPSYPQPARCQNLWSEVRSPANQQQKRCRERTSFPRSRCWRRFGWKRRRGFQQQPVPVQKLVTGSQNQAQMTAYQKPSLRL